MHRYVLLLVDLTLVAVATLFALLLRENLEPSWAKALQIAPYLALTLLAAAPVLLAAGLNRSLWRFSSLVDYVRVAMAVLAIILLAVALGFLLNRMEGVSRSLPILQGLLMVCALIGVRVAMRLRHATRDRAPRVAQSISRPHETSPGSWVEASVTAIAFCGFTPSSASPRRSAPCSPTWRCTACWSTAS